MANPHPPAQSERIRVGYSQNRVNKGVADGVPLRFCKEHQTHDVCWTHGEFVVRFMTEADLGRVIIREGHAISVAAYKHNWRKEANFTSAQLMGADFDYGPDLDAARALPYCEHAFLIYQTPSHTPEAPRTRPLFILDEPITDAVRYKKLFKRFLYALSQHVKLDTSCKDTARIFYGSKGAGFDYRAGARLPVALLEALPPHPDELAAEREAERRATIPHIQPVGYFAEGYGVDFKEARLDTMRRAGQNDRHPTLKFIAPPLIARQKGDWPAYAQVDAEIRDAALSTGLPAHEVDSLIAWCHANIPATPFEAPAPRLEPIYKPTAKAEPKPKAHKLPGVAVGINAFGTKGEGILYRIARAAQARGGTISHVDDFLEWQHAAGIDAHPKTLERYVKASLHEGGTVLTPSDDANKSGVNFVLRDDFELKEELRRRAAIYYEVKFFPAKEQARVNAITGEEYIAEPVPAQLSPLALQAVGISTPVAQQAAEALTAQVFDEKTSRRRWGANKAAQARYEAFCELLDVPDDIPLPDDIEIRTEGDLKRAQARAWIAAGALNSKSKAAQMFALGIASKNTLKTVLADAGIACEENIELVTVTASAPVGDQIQKLRQSGQWARSYRAVDSDGVLVETNVYRRDAVENMLAKGYTVQIEAQGAHIHHVVDVPERETRQRPDAPPAPQPKKKPKAHKRSPVRRGMYPPDWVTGQLRLRYRLMYRREARSDATPLELIEAITGRQFDRTEANPLYIALSEVVAEFGGTMRRRESVHA